MMTVPIPTGPPNSHPVTATTISIVVRTFFTLNAKLFDKDKHQAITWACAKIRRDVNADTVSHDSNTECENNRLSRQRTDVRQSTS